MRHLVATLVLLVPAPALAFDILPLGDSITQAHEAHLGYRYRLWTKLIDSGLPFDLVGSRDSNFPDNPVWPTYMGQSFDQDHEGHWACQADQILNGTDTGNNDPCNGSGKLADWLAGYTPDIVLMHLGTNDALNGESAASTVIDLEGIIDVLRADNPNVIILLAKLIPSTKSGASAIDDVNAEIDGIAASKSTAQSPVIVVDQNTGFDASTDTYDGLHPDDSGEEKMATKWMAAIQAAVAGPSAPAVQSKGLVVTAAGLVVAGRFLWARKGTPAR